MISSCRGTTSTTATTTATPPSPATRTRCKLLPCLLEHVVFTLSRTHNPHHQAVGFRRVLEQECRAETQPTKDLLLVITHGHRHEFGLRTPARRFRSGHGCGARLGNLGGGDDLIRGLIERRRTLHDRTTTATATATIPSFPWGRNLSTGRRSRTCQTCGRCQRLKQILPWQDRHMAQTTTAGAGTAE